MKIIKIFVTSVSLLLLASCGGNNVSHTHAYGSPTWSWDGYKSATATFECSTCKSDTAGHFVHLDADINTKITKQPTCLESGTKTYTASVEFKETPYSDVKTETIAPIGHTYSAPTWNWNGYESATADFVCTTCQEGVEGHKVTLDATISSTHTDATCIEKGHNDYTASVSFQDKNYSDTKVEDLGFGEHKYGEFITTKEPTYEEEGSKSRTCEVCKHVDTVAIPRLKLPYSIVKPLLVAAGSKSPLSMYSGDAFEDALTAYSRLDIDSLTLQEKFEADELKKDITALQEEWQKLYKKVIDINTFIDFENTTTTYLTDINQEKGHMLEIYSTLQSGEAWTYSPNCKVDLGDGEYVQFGYYQDQPGDLLCVNSEWTKFLDLITGEIFTTAHPTKGLKYQAWNQISVTKENWEEMGDFCIAIYLMGDDQGYGIKTGGEPAYLTSFYTSKAPSEEGQTVITGANNITDVQTWEEYGTIKTEISYNVATDHGTATQVDIKAKTTVLELKWGNVDYSMLKNFDYARIYVYATTTQRVFVSLNDWRCNVVSLPNVGPFDSDVGAKADAVQNTANVVADQWNIIDIPTAYFTQDTDNAFFIQIWADQNEAKDGWLFTDIVGHNKTCCLDNGGQLIAHNSSATVTPVSDETYGGVSKVTLAAAQGYVKQNRSIDISKFLNLEIGFINLSSNDINVLLYMIDADANPSIYGNAVKGNYLILKVPAGGTAIMEPNIIEYFGSYASSSSIMFRVDGQVGNQILITSFTGVLAQSGHVHDYGTFISEVPAECEKDGIVGHYHCIKCGKYFDENKGEIESIVVPAKGHSYVDKGTNYECDTCHGELSKSEELVIKKNKDTKQYIFLGSSITNGYHGPNVSIHSSMADFFANDYLLATYTGLSNGKQVTYENAYLRRIENKGTSSEPYLGVYSYDFDTLELKASGAGLYNGKEFNYSVNEGRILITGPSSYLYKFNAVYYGKDNVIKKACDGFTLSDLQPRWATPTYEVTDRHSYVGLMEDLLNNYSGTKVDEFVVQLSTNDLGIYTDSTCTAHLPFGEVTADGMKDITKLDKNTSFGALEWLVAKAKEVWGCRVTIFTCQMYDSEYNTYKANNYDIQSLKGSGYFQMYEAALQVANKWETGLIDIYANKEAEIKLNENKSRYKADIVHLTEIGYEAVMYQIFREFFEN